jgi:hypothetical protein
MSVIQSLAADPARWRYGYDLGAETGLKAGSLYPILIRLADRGLLEAAWEESAPQGRPPRHLYRLTAAGRELAVAAVLPVDPAEPGPAPASRRPGRMVGRPEPGRA